MKRSGFVALLVVLVACSTPIIRLSPRYERGERRTYALEATVDSTAEVRGTTRTERSELKGRSTIEVTQIGSDETTLTLTLSFDEFKRNGRAERQTEQRAEVVVGPNGAVKEVTEIGGLPAELIGVNSEEFAHLIAIPFPQRSLDLGERWRMRLADGVQTGRIKALRAENGYDCAIASSSTVRRVDRTSGGAEGVRLTGTQLSASEVAFAFGEGFPVRVRTDSEGTFAIQSPALASGTLRITAHATMSLLSRSA